MICNSNNGENMTKDNSDILPDQTNDTSSYSEENHSSSSWTSTPVKVKKVCMECRKECLAKRHFAIHIEVGT